MLMPDRGFTQTSSFVHHLVSYGMQDNLSLQEAEIATLLIRIAIPGYLLSVCREGRSREEREERAEFE